MFLATIHEGEKVRLPSGRLAVVLGRKEGAIHIEVLTSGEDFYIMPQFLQCVIGETQPLAASHMPPLEDEPSMQEKTQSKDSSGQGRAAPAIEAPYGPKEE